jgi:hypothetical protein
LSAVPGLVPPSQLISVSEARSRASSVSLSVHPLEGVDAGVAVQGVVSEPADQEAGAIRNFGKIRACV